MYIGMTLKEARSFFKERPWYISEINNLDISDFNKDAFIEYLSTDISISAMARVRNISPSDMRQHLVTAKRHLVWRLDKNIQKF